MLRAASVVALAAASDGRIKHHHDATGRKLTYGSLTASTSVGPSTGWCSPGVGANAELWSNFLCGKSAELVLDVSQDSAGYYVDTTQTSTDPFLGPCTCKQLGAAATSG